MEPRGVAVSMREDVYETEMILYLRGEMLNADSMDGPMDDGCA